MNPPEDFVLASVLVADPGEQMYSCFGHACLRLQCPLQGLDRVFSYEGEDRSSQVLRFLAGQLKMGVFAIPTSDYLALYAAEGRGVKEYKLNLPIAVKQRLWQQMDERLSASRMAYDYMNRGCAVGVLSWIEAALPADSLHYGEWGELYDLSRKEISRRVLGSNNGWNTFFISTIVAGEGNDRDIALPRKVMAPVLLVDVLSNATAYGKPLISDEPVQLVEPTHQVTPSLFTPSVMALLVLLVALLNLRLRNSALRYVLLTAVFCAGCFIAYLVFVSSLTCTQWNWLIVPFNPLPVLLWHWRRHWLLPYAALNLVWVVALLIYPYYMFETAHYILAAAVSVLYVETYLTERNRNKTK